MAGLASTYEIDPLRDYRWNDFVQHHPQSSVFHSVSWLQALKDAYGYEPVVLSTAKPGERLSNGLVFCRVKSRLTGRRLVSLPFSDHCEPLVSAREELGSLLAGAVRTAEDEKGDYVEIRPVSGVPDEGMGLEKTSSFALHVLDLTPNASALFRNFHKDCVQRKIRRAERERLRYAVGNSEELLRHFYRLVIKTRRRQGLPPQHHSWFRHLARVFGDTLQVRLAFQGERCLAGMLTLKHGTTIFYKYGCSDERFHPLGGTALLFWRTIEEAKAEGMLRLELGRSDLENAGLLRFKDNWGTERSYLNYWRSPHGPESTHKRSAKRLASGLVRLAPDWALVAAGRLLYRHIG